MPAAMSDQERRAHLLEELSLVAVSGTSNATHIVGSEPVGPIQPYCGCRKDADWTAKPTTITKPTPDDLCADCVAQWFDDGPPHWDVTAVAEVGLTRKQREAIVAAYRLGYYDIPRQCSQQEVATHLGVSRQAVSERLCRATRGLVEATILTDTGGGRS